jgi:hypothetical protein
MIAACPQTRESVPWARDSRWEAQSPTAQPHQEGVTETSVSVEMGASKTVPPASTREETSSRKAKKSSGREDTRDRYGAKQQRE